MPPPYGWRRWGSEACFDQRYGLRGGGQAFRAAGYPEEEWVDALTAMSGETLAELLAAVSDSGTVCRPDATVALRCASVRLPVTVCVCVCRCRCQVRMEMQAEKEATRRTAQASPAGQA